MEVGRFPLNCLLMASHRCHQQSWCFDSFQVHRLAPILAMSLLVWTNWGMTSYLSRKITTHDSRALRHFCSAMDEAVVKRQYDSGNPALSYSVRTVYSSRCLAFVLSIFYCLVYLLIVLLSLTGCVDPNFYDFPFQSVHNLSHHPRDLFNSVHGWNGEYIHIIFVLL